MKPYNARFASDPKTIVRARHAVRAFASTCGFGDHDVNGIELAAGEAMANAVEHGHREGGSFSISCALQRDALVIVVEDKGAGFDAQAARSAPFEPAERLRGFGIRIMCATMDDVGYEAGGRRVRLIKRLPERARREGRPSEADMLVDDERGALHSRRQAALDRG